MTNLEQGLHDPRMRSRNAIGRAMRPYEADSIHYLPTIEEQIELLGAVTIDEIREFYDKLYGASNLDLAIVGLLVGLCSMLGLPWLVAATVRSLNHVRVDL